MYRAPCVPKCSIDVFAVICIKQINYHAHMQIFILFSCFVYFFIIRLSFACHSFSASLNRRLCFLLLPFRRFSSPPALLHLFLFLSFALLLLIYAALFLSCSFSHLLLCPIPPHIPGELFHSSTCILPCIFLAVRVRPFIFANIMV